MRLIHVGSLAGLSVSGLREYLGENTSSVTSHEPDLGQSVLEAHPLCGLSIFYVLLEGPSSPLLNLGNYQASRDIWYPVSVRPRG